MIAQTDKSNNQSIDLRRQARFWKAQHHRAVQREKRLKEEISQLKKALRDASITNEQLIKDNEGQTARISWLEQQLFGQKSEKSKRQKSPPSNASGGSSSNSLSSTNPKNSAPKEPRKKGKKDGDKGYGRKLRKELPFEEIIIDIPEELRQCPICGKFHPEFPGTEDSEVIDWQITLVRLVYRRKRYRRPCNCQKLPCIYTAPAVPKLIPKGMFSCSFWSQLLIEKFLLQRPLYRVRQVLSMENLEVSGGTLTGGFQRISDLVRPLYTLTIERNRESNHWKMDETRWMVYAEVDGKKGYKHWLWVSITDETCVYLLDPTRSAEVPKKLLGEDAEGIINADRYSAYKALGALILIAYCWSHIRRDFVRIGDGYKSLKKWSDKWVDRISSLFDRNAQRLEHPIDSEAFQKQDLLLRQQIDQVEKVKDKQLKQKTLHSAQRKALESLHNHWSGAVLFVDNPEIPMDNNESERRLRNPVIGRKNYYGSGSLWSGNLAAMMFTIFQTLLMHGLNPKKFLTAYFEQCALNGGNAPENKESFLPWNLTEEQKKKWAQNSQAP